MYPAASEIVDEPGIDGAEENLASGRAGPASRHLVQDPLHLRAAEISVCYQTGLLFDDCVKTFSLQLVAAPGGAPALPDDGVVDRLAARLLPQDRCLTLVGDSQRRNFVDLDPGVEHRLLRGLQLAPPDFLGIVLNPSRPRIDLAKISARLARDPSSMIEEKCLGAGRALIESKNIFLCHV